MDKLVISPETHAATFSECKEGEAITGTFSGTYGKANADGSYDVTLDSVTKDAAAPEAAKETDEEIADMAVPETASPAAAAILKKK